ncbi:MAG: chromate transporter [Clostridia bacterium]|nr:chromate transporter [Clostridia bacterium]
MEKTSRRDRLLPLFLTFLKIGAFTFGGGYAMIPLIQREVVEKHQWISDQDILDIIAIAESTPGPIAINSATFVGYRTAGVLGAILCTLGVVLPSFLVIFGISFVLAAFQENQAVKYAFWGIRAGVLALICKAWLSMYKQFKKSIFGYCVAIGAFVLVVFTPVNVIWVILACGLSGFIYSTILARRNKAK